MSQMKGMLIIDLSFPQHLNISLPLSTWFLLIVGQSDYAPCSQRLYLSLEPKLFLHCSHQRCLLGWRVMSKLHQTLPLSLDPLPRCDQNMSRQSQVCALSSKLSLCESYTLRKVRQGRAVETDNRHALLVHPWGELDMYSHAREHELDSAAIVSRWWAHLPSYPSL